MPENVPTEGANIARGKENVKPTLYYERKEFKRQTRTRKYT